MDIVKERYLKDFNKIYDDLYNDIENEYKKIINDLEKRDIDRIDRISGLKHRIYELEEVEIEILKIKIEDLECENRKLKEEIILNRKSEQAKEVPLENKSEIQLLKDSVENFSNRIEEKIKIKKILVDKKFLEKDLMESEKNMITLLVIAFNVAEQFKANNLWFKKRIEEEKEIKELEKLVRLESERKENYCYFEIPIQKINKLMKNSTGMSIKLKRKIVKIFYATSILKAKAVYVERNGMIRCERKNHSIKNEKFYIKLEDKIGNKYYMLKKWGRICTECYKAYIDTREVPKGCTVVDLIKEEKNQIMEFKKEEKMYSFIQTENQISNIENKNKIEAGNLKEESDLKQLGYSTKLGRIERERILREVAIPKLGKNMVINHLKWLIKMNGKRKAMENSVYIWQNDLKKIM